MTSERIDPEAWARFLESFALQHRGWLVSVESADDAGVRERVFEALPMLNISPDGEGGILVTAGDEETPRQYWAPRVRALVVECAPGGAISRLRIVLPSGETTVAFRSAVPPELVNGVA